MERLLEWLETTRLSGAMRHGLWLYPIVEVVHIVGFSLLVGSVLLFDLRVLGASRFVAVSALGKQLLPWSLASLALVVPAGLLLFAAHPRDFLDNQLFLIKLLLIVTAGLNAVLFHTGAYRSASQWDVSGATPALARAHAALSIAIWITVIGCGRFLAYTG